MCTTGTAHLTLDLIALVTPGDKYISENPHNAVFSSILLLPTVSVQISSSALCSQTPSFVILPIKEQVSHPYKINTLKIALKHIKGWSPLVSYLYPVQQNTSNRWKVTGKTTQNLNIWPRNMNRFSLYSQKLVSCSVRGPDHLEDDQTPFSTCEHIKYWLYRPHGNMPCHTT